MIKPSETVVGGIYEFVYIRNRPLAMRTGAKLTRLYQLRGQSIENKKPIWFFEEIAGQEPDDIFLPEGASYGPIDKIVREKDEMIFTKQVQIHELPLYLYLPYKSKNFEKLISGQKVKMPTTPKIRLRFS